MTIDRDRVIKIPIWLVSIIMPILVTVVTALTVYSSTKAKLEMKAERNECEIEKLRTEKVDRNEFNLVIEKLNIIESKLDKHIAE